GCQSDPVAGITELVGHRTDEADPCPESGKLHIRCRPISQLSAVILSSSESTLQHSQNLVTAPASELFSQSHRHHLNEADFGSAVSGKLGKTDPVAFIRSVHGNTVYFHMEFGKGKSSLQAFT